MQSAIFPYQFTHARGKLECQFMDIHVQILLTGRLHLLLQESCPISMWCGVWGDTQMPVCRGPSFRLVTFPKEEISDTLSRETKLQLHLSELQKSGLYFTPANDHSESYAFSLISSESTLLVPYLGQQSPAFLVRETNFLEDNFSRDGGTGVEGRVVQVVMQAMGRKSWEATDVAPPLRVHGLGVGDP